MNMNCEMIPEMEMAEAAVEASLYLYHVPAIVSVAAVTLCVQQENVGKFQCDTSLTIVCSCGGAETDQLSRSSTRASSWYPKNL